MRKSSSNLGLQVCFEKWSLFCNLKSSKEEVKFLKKFKKEKDSNNISIETHYFKVLVQIHYSADP